MVLPRPTSSAMNRLARGRSRARLSGVSWWLRSWMPARKGAWKKRASVAVTAFRRRALR
jgi:hypothetical protein